MGEFLGLGIGAHSLEGNVLITWTTALSKAMGMDWSTPKLVIMLVSFNDSLLST